MAKRNKLAQIYYDQSARDALAICEKYLIDAAAYIQGNRKRPPNALALVTARFPQTSILQAAVVDRASGLAWPTIEAVIEDRDAPGQKRSIRLFDPWYFVVMLLLEVPGGRFRFDRSKNAKYFYLAYAGPTGKEGNFYLRRIIANTPAWADTREGKHRGDAHYDYRRPTLRRTYKGFVRALGQETRWESRVRDDAIRFAVDLFNRQLATHHGEGSSLRTTKLPGLNKTAKQYETLLTLALNVADDMHEKHLLMRAKEAAQ